MTWTDAEFTEIRALAGNRWSEPRAGAQATWADWRRSLEPRFTQADVMTALIMLSEEHERFPALARLVERCRVEHDRRLAEERPKLAPPQAPTTVERRLAAFDASAAEERMLRHGELMAFQRDVVRVGMAALSAEQLAAEHARIDRIGGHEANAREALAHGADPGRMAVKLLMAYVDAWSGATA